MSMSKVDSSLTGALMDYELLAQAQRIEHRHLCNTAHLAPLMPDTTLKHSLHHRSARVVKFVTVPLEAVWHAAVVAVQHAGISLLHR
jgi:hypothetical protein